MKCVICDNDFEAKRADAKFCSATCRSKGNRMDKIQMKENPMVNAETLEKIKENKAMNDALMEGDKAVGSPVPAPEKIKKGNIDELGTLRPGQTQEEYITNIPERGYLPDGSKCPHPTKEQFYSRCLDCMELVPMEKKTRSPLLKGSDKKK